MLYTFSYTIPKNTPFSEAKEVELALCPGFLTDAIITIPSGVMYLARCQIVDAKNNVLPSTENMFITGDGATVPFKLWYKLKRAPFKLTWKLWNLDDTYDHEFFLALTVLAEEDYAESGWFKRLIEEITKLREGLLGTGEVVEF